MASSKSWSLLASQEAVRVQEQARNAWAARLQPPNVAHAEAAYRQALEEADEAFGAQTDQTPPADRLAHANFLLSRAQKLATSLQPA